MKDLEWELEKQRDAALAEIERLNGELTKWQEAAEKAQAACAEMRQELEETEFGDRHGYDQRMHCFSCGVPEMPDRAHHPKCSFKHALSTGCGSELLAELQRYRERFGTLK